MQKTRRRQLERRWRRSQLLVDRSAFVDQCFLVKDLVFNAKMFFYSTLIHNAGTDSQALSKSIDRLLHRKPEKCVPFCSSSNEIADSFADFFKEKLTNFEVSFLKSTSPIFFAALDTPTLGCSLEYFSPNNIHELSQIACHVGAKS